MLPSIIHEDNHILAVNKPPGLLVQGDETDDPSVLSLMKSHIKKRDSKPGNVFLGLPHRLDRPTSGLLILAKTSKALSRLSMLFRDRKVKKIYWAVVEERPPEQEGELSDWLVKDNRTNTTMRMGPGMPGAKEARLRYKVLGFSVRYFLIEVELITGRHHQIRTQLSGIGCPIKGDLKYGARRSDPGGGIHLHARRLIIPHPVSSELLNLAAKPPTDPLWDVMIKIARKKD